MAQSRLFSKVRLLLAVVTNKAKLFELGYMALCLAGLAAIAWGMEMVYKPLGPIVGGIFAVWLAFLFSGTE